MFKKYYSNMSKRAIKKNKPICNKVLALEEAYASLTDEELKNKTAEFKEQLQNGSSLDDILPDAFAACREAGWRVLHLKAYPVQVAGGIVIHQGRIAEILTGQGKTLTETLPVYLNALSGNGVHVVTANEYLAKRDSEWMGKVYKFLGLTVGLVYTGQPLEEKKAAYNADITYGTNNEFGFDYLRDNMAKNIEEKVQRGHNFAIVDEVDSILIDEARTPLIISGHGDNSSDMYKKANDFVLTLKKQVVSEVNQRDDIDEIVEDEADYVVDEKAKNATLSRFGVTKAEKFFGIDKLTDPENLSLMHYINQALKANGTMKINVDYIVKDGQVLIVDEFTGRIMDGRRFNDGLHQAIEAKEGVEVKKENKTLATITFQNYFRLYKKLSGMTGTAITEEDEFNEIYKLDVVQIPPHQPVNRIDNPDRVFRTEKAKFESIVEEIEQISKTGQPVLVGTVSVAKSEQLSKLLKARKIKHVVLNAKNHEKEAEIVAQAGRVGAVTISTNMAGRGTDIKLGGNAEFAALSDLKDYCRQNEIETSDDDIEIIVNSFYTTNDEKIIDLRRVYGEYLEKHENEVSVECEKVKKLGGLYVIGTERHESRRVDNQLRGRSGRQGDPGASRFYVSLEDDLLRLFGGIKVGKMLENKGGDDSVPIEGKFLTNVIESSQKKLEDKNFQMRKKVIQFDDVMTTQREVIYTQRNRVLAGEDIRPIIEDMIFSCIDNAVDEYCPLSLNPSEWNVAGLRNKFLGWLTNGSEFKTWAFDREEARLLLYKRAGVLYDEKRKQFNGQGEVPNISDVERSLLLRNVDDMWTDHIDAMDDLRKGIGLYSYANKDPIVMYRTIGSEMFNGMNEDIREKTAREVLTVVFKSPDQPNARRIKLSSYSENIAKENNEAQSIKINDDDPCPCGSRKPYKKCCKKKVKK